MLFEKKKQLVLYLEDWQIRMVKDFLNVDCHRWIVPIDEGPVVKYQGPFPMAQAHGEVKRMYLADWQKREIAAETGEQCEFIELHEGTVVRYGAPTPQQ